MLLQPPPLLLGLRFNKVECILLGLLSNRADIVGEADAEAFVRDPQHFRPEGRANELSALRPVVAVRGILVCSVGKVQEMIGDGRPVLGIQVRVDLVEDVEGSRVGGLDGENQGKTAETYRNKSCQSNPLSYTYTKFMVGLGVLTLLSTTQLLNALLVIMLAVEADTDPDTSIILYAALVARLILLVVGFSVFR